MEVEYSTLLHNQTWDVCSLPSSHSLIGCKWVFKLKRHVDGSIARYKARLVAKGYTQVLGFDFTDTFSPVVNLVTVMLFLSIALTHSWPLHQLDIDNAFLNGNLDTELNMIQPLGFKLAKGQNMVCKLKKSLLKTNFKSLEYQAGFCP